ncbi:thioredoxin family protein [Alicyclobacillus sp. ALC3]|nr:thioredoxin family protein [Alicyclobacillus sp. ALC3]
MAVDMQGAEAVRPYVEAVTFPTVVDKENRLGAHFGFTVVPNGIFIDEHGTIRLIKQGFQVTKPEHTEAVEALFRGEVEQVVLDDTYYEPPSPLTAMQKELAATKFRLALSYQEQGKLDDALKELDEALLLNTDNFLIRKQRWYIRFPEKFSPIDIEWQKGQLQREREEEAKQANLVCGPEGCVIPGTTSK